MNNSAIRELCLIIIRNRAAAEDQRYLGVIDERGALRTAVCRRLPEGIFGDFSARRDVGSLISVNAIRVQLIRSLWNAAWLMCGKSFWNGYAVDLLTATMATAAAAADTFNVSVSYRNRRCSDSGEEVPRGPQVPCVACGKPIKPGYKGSKNNGVLYRFFTLVNLKSDRCTGI
jgi:hypothetical protein